MLVQKEFVEETRASLLPFIEKYSISDVDARSMSKLLVVLGAHIHASHIVSAIDDIFSNEKSESVMSTVDSVVSEIVR